MVSVCSTTEAARAPPLPNRSARKGSFKCNVQDLLLYLDYAAARHVLATITRLSAAGSRLGIDLPRRSLQGHRVDDPRQWLRDLGWDAQVDSLEEVARRYGRWPYLAPERRAGLEVPRVFLVDAAWLPGHQTLS